MKPKFFFFLWCIFSSFIFYNIFFNEFLIHLGLYSEIGLSFNCSATGCSLYITLSNSNGLLPLKFTSNFAEGIPKISSTFNKFLFKVDIFVWPYSPISSSIEFDFLLKLFKQLIFFYNNFIINKRLVVLN